MGIEIQLDDDAALALFDFLSRTLDEQNGENLQDATVHDGELWALNSLLCVLEKALTEPFDKNYRDHVKAALEVLTLKSGAWPSTAEK
ncbi:MAG: hypothetical protein AAFY38_03920 [Pseudomonadota bacterium]